MASYNRRAFSIGTPTEPREPSRVEHGRRINILPLIDVLILVIHFHHFVWFQVARLVINIFLGSSITVVQEYICYAVGAILGLQRSLRDVRSALRSASTFSLSYEFTEIVGKWLEPGHIHYRLRLEIQEFENIYEELKLARQLFPRSTLD